MTAELALSGAQAGNYELSSNAASTTADITPKSLTGSFTASNKVYDGNRDAEVATAVAARCDRDRRGQPDVSQRAVRDKNVGDGKTVNAEPRALGRTGRKLQPYLKHRLDDGEHHAEAGDRVVHRSTTRCTTATLTATVASTSLPGVIAPDVVSLDVTGAAFDNKNVGDDKDGGRRTWR